MNTIQYSPRIGPLYRTGASMDPGHTRVLNANSISIVSTVFPGSLGDRPTDHATRSVTIGVQWRSQILLLSTATTSIYWSSRLDRSDQLQQSAAIFSCKIRRVAVYVKTQCNIASKRTFPTGVLERWHNCLLIYMLFSSCIRRYLVSQACDWVMPALSAVLLTFIFQFSLLYFHVGNQAAAASYVV